MKTPKVKYCSRRVVVVKPKNSIKENTLRDSVIRLSAIRRVLYKDYRNAMKDVREAEEESLESRRRANEARAQLASLSPFLTRVRENENRYGERYTLQLTFDPHVVTNSWLHGNGVFSLDSLARCVSELAGQEAYRFMVKYLNEKHARAY